LLVIVISAVSQLSPWLPKSLQISWPGYEASTARYALNCTCLKGKEDKE